VVEHVVQEKHVIFDMSSNEEIIIDLQETRNESSNKQNHKSTTINEQLPQQNKQFSFNRMIRPVRHHLSRFKFF
jgi:hypothetical protein